MATLIRKDRSQLPLTKEGSHGTRLIVLLVLFLLGGGAGNNHVGAGKFSKVQEILRTTRNLAQKSQRFGCRNRGLSLLTWCAERDLCGEY
jgi:hypothetical protein